MRQREFVEVVYMGDSEVERCQKDNFGRLNFGQGVKWNDDGSKQHFFSDGPSDIVAIALPAAQTRK